ncbi:MAG: DegV family protein [Actinobacteria bacterium]|nr:DegV family protein [Actinomycetota bacterium]
MAGVRIVTDSACDLPEDLVRAHRIEIVPLAIRFGDEELVDREQLSVQEFYDRMATSPTLPSTAAPAPGRFAEAFHKAAADGADAVVCINLSAALSATMQSAENAARELQGDLDVRVLDSKSITMGLGSLVVSAAEAAEAGASADEVVARVEAERARTHVVGALDTLENLKKGGRIGNAQALLGGMLSIKPLVDLSTGEVKEAGKQRTRGKALRWLRDRLFEQSAVERLAVVHGFAPDLDEFLDLIAERHPRDQITVTPIGPVIGTHGGPRIIGLTWQDPA